jgi:hypothetical protein
MTIKRPCVKGLVYVFLSLVALCVVGGAPAILSAQTLPDSLTLRKPDNVDVWRTYDAAMNQFIVYIRWEDPPDNLSTFIHQPDTSSWRATTPPEQLSIPVTRGNYSGDIDRTVKFRAVFGAAVGQDTIPITYWIELEDEYLGRLEVGNGYTPGTWLPVMFSNGAETLDYGLEIMFPPGIIDANGSFQVGMEDFEGFHVWRGIEPDGSDLQVIGEISKQEAFAGTGRGGNMVDSLYLYSIIPSLRATGVYHSPFTIDCLGYSIRADLEDNELLWFDCNAFNGFNYYYLVTTFDRDYQVTSKRQGLNKFDRCQPAEGIALADSCQAELFPIKIEVDPQNTLSSIYAVPNPYRTGGSRLTTSNYHNFPDDKVSFVNVPTNCKIKIFTVSGDLVWEHEHTDGTGNIEWSVTNRGGEDVASGVYIYKIEDPNGGHMYGRLIIIR